MDPQDGEDAYDDEEFEDEEQEDRDLRTDWHKHMNWMIPRLQCRPANLRQIQLLEQWIHLALRVATWKHSENWWLMQAGLMYREWAIGVDV